MDFNWKKLNFPEQGKLDYIKKYITDLKLRSDDEDYIYYHDVICKIIIAQLGSQVDRANPENALIIKTEKKVQERIKRMIESYIGFYHKKEKSKKNIYILKLLIFISKLLLLIIRKMQNFCINLKDNKLKTK